MLEVHLNIANMKKDCMMFKNYNANWLFADRVFRLVYNNTHNSSQAHISLRRYTAAAYTTSNTAAITVVDRMHDIQYYRLYSVKA